MSLSAHPVSSAAVPAVPLRRARDFLDLPRSALRSQLAEGHPIDPRALDDSEYRGVSLGLPRFVEALTWKKFKKVFHRDPLTGLLRGWNVRLEQNMLDGPCVPRLRHGTAVTFGHYRVVDPKAYRMPANSAGGLLIHYGLGNNSLLDPMRFVLDAIVAVNPGDAKLLLGRLYVGVGPLRIPTPSYFTLEYECPLRDVVRPGAAR